MTEEEYLATVTRCREIRSTIEAMMGGKTPAQLEGYPKGESERINNMRYAQLVGIWLKDWRDEDGSTNENGRQRVLEWLAQNYGLGLKVELDTDNFGIGGFSKVTVWLESTDITSKTKLSTFNKKCATIDKNGNIKAVSDGAGNITISYGKIKIKKKIVVGEGNLHLNPKGYNELTVGDTQNMSLRTENSSNVQGTPKWTSSNTSVLTVTHSGKVSAKKAGKATITCTYHNQEYKKSFTVEARVELDYRSMTLVKGNSKKLTLLGADGSKVRWGTKGGAGVVSLSKTTGKTVTVSARSAGKATVVASYKGKNYTCSVKVKNPVKKQTVVGSYEGSMTYYDRGLFGDLRQTLTGSVYISISKASEDHCRQYGCEYTGKEYEVYWNMRGQDGIKIKGFSDDRSGLVIVKGSSTSISANTKYGNTHVSASGGSVSIQYYLQKEDGSDKLLVVNARGKKMKK